MYYVTLIKCHLDSDLNKNNKAYYDIISWLFNDISKAISTLFKGTINHTRKGIQY